MIPKRYRKRPGEIEAMRWDGTPESADAIMAWCPQFSGVGPGPVDCLAHGQVLRSLDGDFEGYAEADDVFEGDWVVREPNGTFRGVRASVFAETYEPAD